MKKYHYVYITVNLITGGKYVGDRSCDCLPEEDNYLGSGRPLFKDALNKYGKENFRKRILEKFKTREEAHLNEEKYIRLYKTHVSQNGYNLSWKGGYGANNDTLSEETRKKISKAKTGKKMSDKARLNMSKNSKGKNSGQEPWNKNIHLTDDHKEKIRRGNKGKKITEETRLKMSISAQNKKKTEEHKKNIGKALKGKKLSEEHRRKISKNNAKYNLGRKLSEETKKKISLNNSSNNPEVKEKMSRSKKGKSWEEIYGAEGARVRRENIKKRKLLKISQYEQI
jgi:hypothetical protein